MRILTVVSDAHPDLLEGASRALWGAYWQNNQDIEDASVLASSLAEGTGADAATVEAWIAAAGKQETKDALKAATAEAVERGAFGAPTMFITPDTKDGDVAPEMFFGSDRFELIASMFNLPWHGPRGPPKSKL